MGSSISTPKTANKEVIPPWVYTVKIPPEFAGDKLGGTSDGMTIVGPNTVTRTRPGQFDTDGARWSRGFTSGKHTFEIVFPAAQRGLIATVGVGTDEAPLFNKDRVPLCGNNRHSWGICLRARRAWHRNAVVKKYPQSMAFLPDKFYMYLDADAGTLMFGSDLDFYGGAINNIPRLQALYPMVCPTTQGATITIVYRGQGNLEALAPQPLVAPQPVAYGGYGAQPPQPVGYGGYEAQPPQPVGYGGYEAQPPQPVGYGGYEAQPPQPVGYGGYEAQPPQPVVAPMYPVKGGEEKGGALPPPLPEYSPTDTSVVAVDTHPPAYSPAADHSAAPLPSKTATTPPPENETAPPPEKATAPPLENDTAPPKPENDAAAAPSPEN